MQFSAVLVAFLTSAPLLVSITPPKLSHRLMRFVSAMADLHKELLCIKFQAGPEPFVGHDEATKSACEAYKARNTGTSSSTCLDDSNVD